MDNLRFIVYIGLLHALIVSGQEYCFYDGSLEYCRYDCCSDGCCSMSTGVIVGIVIGVLFIIGGIVCCIVCCVCLAQSRPHRQTGPQPVPYNSNAVFVTTTTHGAHPPPSYNQNTLYPPAGSSGNAAFPPPGTANPPPAYTYSQPPGAK